MTTASAISGAIPFDSGAAAALAAAPQRPAGRGAATSPRAAASKAGAAAKASTGASAKAATGAAASAKATSASSAAAAAKPTSSTSKSSSSSKAGYAAKLPAEFAFLKDPKLSIEEKLSRFIGLMMTRSEQRLQEQMEKMAAGSTGADGTSSSSGTKSSSSSSSSKSGFSLWSLAKALVPPLGLASSLLGDSTVKSLLGEVSGPVLAAAATALGLPELAPFALKVGPEVAKLVSSDAALSVPGLDAAAVAKDIAKEAVASASGSTSRPAPASTSGTQASTSSSSSSSTKTTASDGSTSEKAQLLELQRLQDQDKELFALFSNMLKSMHDARMTAVQNIR